MSKAGDGAPATTPGPADGQSAGRLRTAGRALVLDVGPLRRHRDFRLLFLGQAVSFFGSMITYVALPYQVYRLTHSSLDVGLLGVAELVPILTLALFGGALADALDRRLLVFATEGAFTVGSAVLVTNASLPHPRLWLLYVLAAVFASVDALQRPALDALAPRLVTRDELTAASALGSFRMTLGMVAGPAVGGVLVATAGLAVTYGVDLVTFLVSLVALSLMRAVPPPADAEPVSLRRVAEGLRYARSRPELMGTYVVDIVAMFFGMPTALFPGLATHLGGASALGLLYAAPSVGSLLATATSGWTGRVHRHGLAVVWAAGVWGAAVIGAGAVRSLAPVLVFLAVAGGADMVSGIFRSTIWSQTIPDELRGRLAGVEMISYSSGPLLGNVESGAAASVVGLRPAVWSGGVLCVVGVALTALALPAFRQYDSRRGREPGDATSAAAAAAGEQRPGVSSGPGVTSGLR